MNQKTVVYILLLVILVSGIYYLSNKPTTNNATPSADTVNPLTDGYIVRGGRVFYVTLSPTRSEYMIPNADSTTFKSLDRYWGKDAQRVFYMGLAVVPASTSTPVIDPFSFESINGTYFGKDRQAVYVVNFDYIPAPTGSWKYSVFPGADPATFIILFNEYKEPVYAKDKSSVWNIAPGEGGPAREKINGVNPANCTADNLAGCTLNK